MSHPIRISRLSPLGIAILTLLFLLALVAHAQDGKPATAKELKPTEIQSLHLQLKYKDALLAKQRLEALQTVMNGAQADYQRALKDLTDEAEKVKAEQKWPSDTQFDPNQLSFVPAPLPAKKEEPKKP